MYIWIIFFEGLITFILRFVLILCKKSNFDDTFNNVFCNRIFSYYRFLPIFKK